MGTLVWALGSMCVVALLLFLFPLKYNRKGKLFIVFTSFILALGGIAAISIFPLWQTSLMLVALTFLVAYIMNSRFGTRIIKTNSAGGAIYNGQASQESLHKVDNYKGAEILSVKENYENHTLVMNGSAKLETFDDNSFLGDRKKVSFDLSDIESLLAIENETNNKDLFEKIPDLSPIIINEKIEERNEKADMTLDDSLFDFLRAQNEAAADPDDRKKKTKEKLIL